MKQNFFLNRFGQRRILIAALLVGLLVGSLSVFLNDNMGNDTAMYYSRMTQAFIDANYSRAFFHSIPPLVPAFAGVIGKVGVNGWTAMKMLSALCFLGAIYWAYRLFLLVLPDRQAQWGAFLYAVCSRLIHYGAAGQLEASKMFLLLFSFERTFSFLQTRRNSALLGAAIGGAFLILARNEGIMYLPVLMGFVFFAEWLVESSGSFWLKVWKGVSRCLLLAIVVGAICSPWLVYQYKTTGYAVVGTRQVSVLSRKIPFVDTLAKRARPDAGSAALEKGRTGKIRKSGVARSARKGTLAFRLKETVKGIYPLYFIPMLAGLFILLRRKAWRREYGWFLAVFIYQLFIDWTLRPLILKRFIIPAIPFYFPLLIAGLAPIAEQTFRCGARFRRLACYLAVLLCTALLCDGLRDVRKTICGRTAEEKQLGRWIKTYATELDVRKTVPLKIGRGLRGYHTGADLLIASTVPQPAFWAGCDLAHIPESPDFKDIRLFLEQSGADLVIADAKFIRRFPEFVKNPAPYRQLEHFQEKDKLFLFVYTEVN